MRFVIFILFIALLTACASSDPAGSSSHSPSTGSTSGPISAPPASVLSEREVADLVDAAVGEFGFDLVRTDPVDASEWCPGFPGFTRAEKHAFFVKLMTEMARYESSFKPATKYTEAFNDSNGDPVISRGLFQISIESANGYGCGFRAPEELHDPQANANCSVRILNRWVERDERIGSTVGESHLGGARYWSVLRKGSKSRLKILAAVRAWPGCGQLLDLGNR